MTTSTAAIRVLGGILVTKLILDILGFIWLYMKPSKLDRFLHSRDGHPAWALVTGASDGIGRALAYELAAKGFNVVIHGRNPSKTEAVFTGLQKAYPHQKFRKFVCDGSLATTDSVSFTAIAEQLRDLHLTVLINNAGASPRPSFGPLWEYSEETVTGTVRLNTLFPLLLTRQLLPQMFASQPALIMFIGSLSDNGLPLLVSYGSSKRFIMQVATSLGREMVLEGHDVEVLGIRVGEVTGVSNIHDEPQFGLPEARTMAKAALSRAGHGSSVVIGYWQHAIQLLGTKLLPQFLLEKLFRDIMQRRRIEEQTTGKYS